MRLRSGGAALALLMSAALLVSVAPVAAEQPVLGLPIDCILGQTCYIEDYVDAQPGPGQTDYTCGLKSRNDHRGTDIALLSFEAMEAGVNVLAAAPGIVAATRDGVPDRMLTDANRADIEGRECGNAVRIDHGNGWQTLYCHLKRDSLTVQTGDAVMPGDILGEVGLSGQTNYPHVHIGVLQDGEMIDPFNPQATETCGAGGDTLWRDTPDYTRSGLFTAGFSSAVPSFEDVQSGAARMALSAPDEPLVLYGHAFYPEQGDVLTLTVFGPEGEIFDHSEVIRTSQAQNFRAYGRRAPSGGWPSGPYRGSVKMERRGAVIAIRHADIIVD